MTAIGKYKTTQTIPKPIILESSVRSHNLIEIESLPGLAYVGAAGVGVKNLVSPDLLVTVAPIESGDAGIIFNRQDRKPSEVCHRVNAYGRCVFVVMF